MTIELLFEKMQQWHKAGELPIPTEQVIPHRDECMKRFHLLYEECLEFKNAIQDEDLTQHEKKTKVLDAFSDILYVLIGGYVEFGFDPKVLIYAFDEVHTSNMTKVQDSGKIIRNEYGKILKPESYVAPNLNQFIR